MPIEPRFYTEVVWLQIRSRPTGGEFDVNVFKDNYAEGRSAKTLAGRYRSNY